MLNDHPLFGKETVCHKCSGVAVWVFNGDMVGNYHYCRACKLETGPFAKSSLPPVPPASDQSLVSDWISFDGVKWFPSNLQVDTQLQMQDRMDQLLFDFMKPPSTEEALEQLGFINKADHPV